LAVSYPGFAASIRGLATGVRTRDNLDVTTVRPDSDIRPVTSDGEHERFAHYVKKGDIMRSAVEGVAVEALCGKKWIPDRDPQRYPVCPTCKEILAQLRSR
jgi:hypothetical protein